MTCKNKKYKELRIKNLNKQEYQIIKALRHDTDIIIKPTNKGSAIDIMDKATYIQEVQGHMSETHFCEPTNTDLIGEVI